MPCDHMMNRIEEGSGRPSAPERCTTILMPRGQRKPKLRCPSVSPAVAVQRWPLRVTHEDRHLRSYHHFLMGKRTRHHLSIACEGARGEGPSRPLHRERRRMVSEQSGPAASELLHSSPL